MAIEARFNIGTQFLSADKHPRLCTVIDILKTYNSKGELVRVRYVATHQFMGQMLIDGDVGDTTIAKGKWALEQPRKPSKHRNPAFPLAGC